MSPITKQRLFDLLTAPDYRNTPVTLKGVTGYIAAIEREDGSGSSFNVRLVRLENDRNPFDAWVHIRTID